MYPAIGIQRIRAFLVEINGSGCLTVKNAKVANSRYSGESSPEKEMMSADRSASGRDDRPSESSASAARSRELLPPLAHTSSVGAKRSAISLVS